MPEGSSNPVPAPPARDAITADPTSGARMTKGRQGTARRRITPLTSEGGRLGVVTMGARSLTVGRYIISDGDPWQIVQWPRARGKSVRAPARGPEGQRSRGQARLTEGDLSAEPA